MADTAAAAMTFVSATDALIIDLRQNNGGSPDGVAFLANYLFAEPQRVNDSSSSSATSATDADVSTAR